MIGLKQHGNRPSHTLATVFPIVARTPDGAVSPAGLHNDHGLGPDLHRVGAVVAQELIQPPANRFGADHHAPAFGAAIHTSPRFSGSKQPDR